MHQLRGHADDWLRRVFNRLARSFQPSQWTPGVAGFILVVALFNAALYHLPLFSFAVAHLDYSSTNGILTLSTLFILVAFVTALVLCLISLISQRLLKPACMLGAACNAVALYFIQTYQVVLDKSMMGNVFNTNFAEAGSLFHPKLLVYLMILGVLPCWFLWRVQIQKTRILPRIGFLLVVLLFGVGWMYANSKTWLWFDKHAKRLGGMILPWSYVINTSRHFASHLMASREQTLLPDAIVGAIDKSIEKTIVLLVIGESARAQNFSLYGYGRATNPLTAKAGAVSLPHSHACATYTTASLHCILSHNGNSHGLSSTYEPLPSYLQRHGIDVIWRTNNWGEPPLKVQTYQRAEDLRRECKDNACSHDEVLLYALDRRIRDSQQEKIFVVLHQAGSHGPAYYSKYPKEFEVFKPVCKSVELHQCTNDELVNAYDNTIVYTDHFLHRAIGLLKSFPKAVTMLMYVSDHGESLGEYGLYLHGTPYSIAPDVQKDIPFLVWMSEPFMKAKHISNPKAIERSSHSHENVFHSVMGAFDMRSVIYNDQLDLFSGNPR